MDHSFSYHKDGSEVTWDVKDIWKAAEKIPVEMMDVQYLFSLVKDQINNFDKDDYARAKEADTSYPIIVDSNVRIVLDGVHRIYKLVEVGGEVSIKRIKKMPPPKEAHGKPFKIDGLEFVWPKVKLGTECFSNKPKTFTW